MRGLFYRIAMLIVWGVPTFTNLPAAHFCINQRHSCLLVRINRICICDDLGRLLHSRMATYIKNYIILLLRCSIPAAAISNILENRAQPTLKAV